MGRRARRRRAIQQQAIAQTFSSEARQEVFDDAYTQGFDKGFQKAQDHYTAERNRLIAETERQAMEKARQKPFMVLAHRNGYNEGYEVGFEKGYQKGQLVAPKHHFSYKDLEQARQRGFDDGYRAGRSSAPNVSQDASARNGVIDEVLQNCEVIAQSNPNMAPGVNAVRHMVRKLRKS